MPSSFLVAYLLFCDRVPVALLCMCRDPFVAGFRYLKSPVRHFIAASIRDRLRAKLDLGAVNLEGVSIRERKVPVV